MNYRESPENGHVASRLAKLYGAAPGGEGRATADPAHRAAGEGGAHDAVERILSGRRTTRVVQRVGGTGRVAPSAARLQEGQHTRAGGGLGQHPASSQGATSGSSSTICRACPADSVPGTPVPDHAVGGSRRPPDNALVECVLR